MIGELLARPESQILPERDTAVSNVIDMGIALVAERYGSGSDHPLPRHELERTYDVMDAAAQLADLAIEHGKITPEQKQLILIAAAYRNVVHENGSDMNEEMSADMAAANMLRTTLFDLNDVKVVHRMIIATRLWVDRGNVIQAANHEYLTKLMADADLAALGQTVDILLDRSRKQLQEQENLEFLPKMTPEYADSQLELITGHNYNTPEAEELFPYKRQNTVALMGLGTKALNATN